MAFYSFLLREKNRFFNSLNACNIYNVPLGCHNDTKLGLGSYQQKYLIQVPNRRWSSCLSSRVRVQTTNYLAETQRRMPKGNFCVIPLTCGTRFHHSSIPVWHTKHGPSIYVTECDSPAVQHCYTVCCFVDSSAGVNANTKYENTTYKLDVLRRKKQEK